MIMKPNKPKKPNKHSELLFSITKKDFTVQTFKSGGKGGQHQNKTNSGVRIIHKPSGAVGECRSTRSQHRNKRLAFERLTETTEFKLWVNRMAYEMREQKTIEQKVQEQMEPENLKIEIKEDNKWKDFLD